MADNPWSAKDVDPLDDKLGTEAAKQYVAIENSGAGINPFRGVPGPNGLPRTPMTMGVPEHPAADPEISPSVWEWLQSLFK